MNLKMRVTIIKQATVCSSDEKFFNKGVFNYENALKTPNCLMLPYVFKVVQNCLNLPK